MDKAILQKTELPHIFTVSKVVKENADCRSIFLKGSVPCKPGQFIMVWLPGVEEKPMAISYHSTTEFGFTFHTLGKFTKACNKLKKGDKVGIRGPYGNSFSIKSNACVVGGGVGMASVSTLIDKLRNPIIINGARTKNRLVYLRRYAKKNMITTTDDGSHGHKGFTTDVLKDVLEKNKIKTVYTCGPEIMMKKVLDVCNKYNVSCEASLERYMKCGFGICGNCMCDDKIICIDGPIFKKADLNKLKEFGHAARLKTGKKVSLATYHQWRT